jgi:DNA polymerase-3 subunit alpha
MTATINNYGGFYRTEAYVHEARMHGAQIEAPCVNRSSAASVIHGTVITLGLQFVKNLEHETIAAITAAQKDGEFASLDDFLNRVAISLEQAVILARVGALRFTGLGKKEILWQLHFRLSKTKTTRPLAELFSTQRKSASLPALEHHWLEDAYDELELIGFPLCNPFDLLAEQPTGHVAACDFKKHIGRSITTIGYKITVKPTRTKEGKNMFFGTFIDSTGQFIDTVHFPGVAEKFPVSGWGIFEIKGKVMEDFDSISIEVVSVVRLPLQPDPRLADTPSHPSLMSKPHTRTIARARGS